MLSEFVRALWIFLPSYVANAFPPLLKGKKPLDFGKNFIDGRRILGDGKTIEGFIGGVIAGSLTGLVQSLFNVNGLPEMLPEAAFLISLGALTGDSIGSFIKRRLGLKRGDDAPLLDQLDFLLLSMVFASLFFTLTVPMIVFLLVFTPIAHRITNILGYALKIKNVPW